MDLPSETCPSCKFGNGFPRFAIGEQNPLANLLASGGFGAFIVPYQGRQSWGSWGETPAFEEEEEVQSQVWENQGWASPNESSANEDEAQSCHDQSVGWKANVDHEQTHGGKAKFDPARLKYFEAFPTGHDVIPTPGGGLLCGFHAVIRSMEAMDPDLARPTVEELQIVFKSLGNAEFGLDNDNYFTVDQVGAALYFWGTKYDMNLQLGYVPFGEPPVLLPHPNDDATTVVFIQHAPGHFSGLRPKKAVYVENVANIALEPKKDDSEDGSEDDMMCG